MNTKLVILLVLGSLFTVTIVSSITNFVSAVKVECFGGDKIDHYICVTTKDDGTIDVRECIRNEEGRSECTTLNSKPTPPGIEQSIQNGVIEESQTNTNNPKDLGEIKSDKGITKGPIN